MAHDPVLFLPGPTEVFPEVLAQMARPVISHRGPEIQEITAEIFEKLGLLFRTTEAECFTATSAATGIMEGAARNLSRKRILATVCGAFSERQFKVAEKCGKAVDRLDFEWGTAVRPERVGEALRSGDYDLVTVAHSETSTGVLNPIEEISSVVHEFDDVMLSVDCVSALGGAPFEFDRWGVDLAFAGVQKCMALPPGIAMFAVSPRAMERAASIPDRGHYFDFLNYRKMAARNQTPATTCVSLMFALQFQLRRIEAETMEGRWTRHADMAALVRERLGDRYDQFPEAAHRTPTESVFRAPEGVDVGEMIDAVHEKGKLFGNGYGELKGITFRIGHMGDLTVTHMRDFLDLFDEVLGHTGA